MNTQRIASIALIALLAWPLAQTGQAGVQVDSVAGFDIEFSGLVQFDVNRFDTDAIDYQDDEDLRRVELKLGGERGDFSWDVGYDAEGEKFLDNNIAFRAGPARIKLGQFKMPSGLEELSSTKNNDFIAKAMSTNAFAVSRRLGAAATFGGERWTATASVFDGELTQGSAAGSGAAGRVTFSPVNRDGSLVHLGLSAARSDLPGDVTRFRARPNADLAAIRPVDTGTIQDADEQDTVGLEGIWTRGPIKVQGEYLAANIRRDGPARDFSGDAWYVSTVWNITGEPWNYRSGVIRTASPQRPDAGMWQAGLRYDRIDLDDDTISGGRMRGLTLGVNYYWRANWKIAANLVSVESQRGALEDEPRVFELRAQFYW